MIKKNMTILLTVALIFVFLCLFIVWYLQVHGNDANKEFEQRIRNYFNISSQQQINNSSIKDSILMEIPVGSSFEQALGYLTSKKIGRDALSTFYPINKDKIIIIRTEYNPRFFFVVKRRYTIKLMFGVDDKLQDINIESVAIGP